MHLWPSIDKGWRLTQKYKSYSPLDSELQRMRFFAAVNKNQLWPWLSWNIRKLRSIEPSIWNCHKVLNASSENGANKGILLVQYITALEERVLSWVKEVSSLNQFQNSQRTDKESRFDQSTFVFDTIWRWTTISELFRFICGSEGTEKGGSLEKWDKRVKSVGGKVKSEKKKKFLRRKKNCQAVSSHAQKY